MPDTGIFGGGSDQSSAYTDAANVQAGAATAAADKQLQAAQESNALIKDMYLTGRADLAPWRSQGQMALDVYGGMLGLPSIYSTTLPNVPGQTYPDLNNLGAMPKTSSTSTTGTTTGTVSSDGSIPVPGQGINGISYYGYPTLAAVTAPKTTSTGTTNALTLANYNKAISKPSTRINPTAWIKQTPGYSFQYNEGLNALDRSAASKGMLLSGQQTRAAQEYGQNFALSQYDNYMNKLSNLAGIGQTTAGQTASLGNQMATASGANTMTGATNAAQANMSGANAIGSGYVNAANAAQQNSNSMWSGLGSAAGLGLGALGAWGGGAGASAGIGGALSTIGGWFSSDKRLKENIVEMEVSGLPMVEKMQPVYFDYLPGVGGLDQLGFVADDIEQIIPSAVVDHNGFKMLNPMPIMAVLVKAIKEQQKQIDDLKGGK